MLLQYNGRKTGRHITIPIGYFPRGDNEVLAVSSVPTWVANLRDGRSVRLRIRGRWHNATPNVQTDAEAKADLFGELAARMGPKSLTLMGLPGDRPPTRNDLRAAAAGPAHVVAFRLSD